MGSDAHQGAFADKGRWKGDGEIYGVWGSSIKKRNLRKKRKDSSETVVVLFHFFSSFVCRSCIGCGHVISRGVGLPVF